MVSLGLPPTPVLAGLLVASVAFGIVMLVALIRLRYASRIEHEFSSLNDISRELLRAPLDVDQLCEILYRSASQIIDTSFFQLGLFVGDTYHVKLWVRDGERHPPEVFGGAGARGLIGWVRESGQPLLVRDFQSEAESLPARPTFRLEDPPQSGLFVPLIAGDSTLGVIAIQSRLPRSFTDEHLRVLTALANQAAWAIRNAQLYEHANRRAEHLRLIGEISAKISSIQPLQDLFRQVVALVRETFGYYCVTVFAHSSGHLQVGASTSLVFMPQTAYDVQGMILWAFREGKTVLANDVSTEPLYTALSSLPETHSEIALPLKVEGRVLGVLDVQSSQLNAFEDEDVFVLETLAAQIAVAIEQAETYASERRLAERLEALVQVSQAVAGILDLDELLDRVVEQIIEYFGFERVNIFIRLGSRLVFRAGAGPQSVTWMIEGLTYPATGPGVLTQVLRSGEALNIPDTKTWQGFKPTRHQEDARALMVVPIKIGERVLGVIELQADEAGVFNTDDVVLMRALADSVAVALRNATLYAAERRRRNLAETLSEIGNALVSDLDLEQVLDGILSGLGNVVAVDNAALLLFNHEAGTVSLAAALGDENMLAVVGEELPLEVLQYGDDVPIETAIQHLFQIFLGAQFLEERSTLTVPLNVSGSEIGYLLVDHHEPGHYGAAEREIIRAFANQAAIAISNARLYEAQQAEAYVTTVLLQVAEAANAEPDIDSTLDTIARLTSLLVGIERCVILAWDESDRTFSCQAQYGIDLEHAASMGECVLSAEEHPFLDLMSVADQVRGAGGPDELPLPEPLQLLLGSAPVLAFPLRARRGLVGLMIVDSPRVGQAAGLRLRNVLRGVAHQAAVALESAILQQSAAERDRLQRELEVAHSIQASLIPDRPPQLPGWDLAAAWRSARQVSGDFYDFIPLRDGLWGLVMADVADKGIPASLFMAMCRTMLRGAAISRVAPAETLERVNTLIFNDSTTDLFVTVFYAVWNPLTGELRYASGGHNPAIYTCTDGGAAELRSRGIALGVLPEISLEEHSITLAHGESLIAYTDGVTEAMTADYAEWGVQRLIQTVNEACGASAHDVIARVLQEVDTFVAGAPQSDDLTIWCLRRLPE